jgi:hypothetical protein
MSWLASVSVVLALSLFVAVIALLEVWHISGQSRGDPDLSHGLQISRWFMATIALANGARLICSLLAEVYAYTCDLMHADMKEMVLVVLRVCPSLLYFTMYSLLTVYFAQLSYTVKGLPFFHVRNSWFITNLLLYAIVLLNFVLVSSAEYVYLSIFVAYALNLIVMVWFSASIFSYFPNVASGNVLRVFKRLLPLVVVCVTGLAFTGLNYILLYLRAAPSTNTIGTGTLEFSLVEVALLIMAEIAPSLAFLYLVSKRKTEGERSSLLTTVVNQGGAMGSLLGDGGSNNSIEGVGGRGVEMFEAALSRQAPGQQQPPRTGYAAIVRADDNSGV